MRKYPIFIVIFLCINKALIANEFILIKNDTNNSYQIQSVLFGKDLYTENMPINWYRFSGQIIVGTAIGSLCYWGIDTSVYTYIQKGVHEAYKKDSESENPDEDPDSIGMTYGLMYVMTKAVVFVFYPMLNTPGVYFIGNLGNRVYRGSFSDTVAGSYIGALVMVIPGLILWSNNAVSYPVINILFSLTSTLISTIFFTVNREKILQSHTENKTAAVLNIYEDKVCLHFPQVSMNFFGNNSINYNIEIINIHF